MSAPSPSRRLLGRFLLVVVGVALALAVAEVGLRVGARFVDRTEPPAAQGAWRVLCMGDSFTYGLGSEDGRGYPEHLQALLDAAWGPGVASVVNRGVPGLNSSQVADRLPSALEEVRPHVLILAVGHNNGWNFNGLHLREPGPGLRLARALGGLRVVRLLQIAARWDLGEEEAPAEATEAATRWHKELSSAEKAEKYARERADLEADLAARPGDAWALVKMSVLEEGAGRPEEAARWLARAREADPAAVDRLLEAQRRIEGWHAARERAGEASDLERRPGSIQRVWEALGDAGDRAGTRALLDDVLRRDLAAMVALARASGAEVVFTGYASATKTASPALSAAAEAAGAPFVDQEADFDALVASGVPQADLFVLDGHCTSAGYRRMAENLVPVLAALPGAPVPGSVAR